MRIPGQNLLRATTEALLHQWARWFGHDLFLSYRRTDGLPIARWLHDEHQRQFLVFFDRTGIDFGERFDDRIARAVRKAKMLVVVLTPDALQAKWVRDECELYRQRPLARQWIVPVFVHPITAENLPADWSWIRGHHGIVVDADSRESLARDGYAASTLAQPVRNQSTGVRRRTVAVRTLGGALLFALLVVGWSLHTKDLRARRDALVTAAATMAGEHRYLEAAQRIEQAVATSGKDAELEALQRRYRDRAPLRPYAAIEVPANWSMLAIDRAGDEPRLVLQDSGPDGTQNERIAITGPQACLHVLPTPGASQVQLLVHDGVLFVVAAGVLHRLPLGDPRGVKSVALSTPSNVAVSAFDADELTVANGTVRVLARALEPPLAMLFAADDLSPRGVFPVPAPDERQELLRLSRRRDDLVFAFGRLRDPTALQFRCRSLAIDGTWRPETSITVPTAVTTAMPSLWQFELAPGDGALFAVIHEQDFFANRSSVRWLAIDLSAPRQPLWMEPSIERLHPLPVHGPFEAVYRLESRELRALQFVDFMRLDRPAVTLTPRADAFAVAKAAPAGHSFRAFAIDREDLRLLDDAEPGQRSAWQQALGIDGPTADQPAPTPLRLHLAADASYLAAEFDVAIAERSVILVWRLVDGSNEANWSSGSGWLRCRIPMPN